MEYEHNGDRDKNLSIKKYLNKIKPYLEDIITDFQKADTWEIQLRIAINFISSKDENEEKAMFSKSNNIDVATFDEIIEERFESFFSR